MLHKMTLQILMLCVVLLIVGCGSVPEVNEGVRVVNLGKSLSVDSNWLEIAWSPDGQNIAGKIFTGPGSSGVFVLDLKSGETHAVFEEGPDSSHGPEWSPDGNSLIFYVPNESVSETSVEPFESVPPYNIVIVDAQSGELKQDLGYGSYATWSREPDKVIYIGSDDESLDKQVPIYEVNLETGNSRQIWQTIASSAQVSDGLDASSTGLLAVMNQTELQIIDIASSNHVGSIRPKSNLKSPVWSPDGQILAYTLDNTNYSQGLANDHIYLSSADGSCTSDPLDLNSRIWTLDWSPDGRQLVFSTFDPGKLYFISLADGIGEEWFGSYLERCSD